MKKHLLFLLFILIINDVNAQFKPIAEGPSFKEPEEGYAKILQMKNGSTVFIVFTPKSKLDVRVYDPSHKEIAVNSSEPENIKFNKLRIKGIFEISGDAVIMLTEFTRTPTLYRLIVDGKTGSLKDETKVAQLDKVGLLAGYAVAFGDVPIPDFFVRKDPGSDNYAVVLFNSFVSERSKRIEIVGFGPDNKETKRAYYSSPQERYKYLRYIDMAVIGKDKISVLAYAYNTAGSGGKESEMILANLDKGASAVTFTELDFSRDLIVDYGITRYNPVVKSLIVGIVAKTKQRDKNYVPMIAIVDPFERKILRAEEFTVSDRINSYFKKGYRGLPQNIFINDDGTFTVVNEEMSISTYSSSTYSTTTTFLGSMDIVRYSKTGEYISDYLIRKSHFLKGQSLSPFYLSEREGTAQGLISGNQYKSFAYIDGKTQSYILFNDTERNNKNQEKGSLVDIQGVSDCDGFYYPLTGQDVVPKRSYVFGDPAGKHDHNLGLFAISDYDRRTNIYTTLELSKQSGKKEVKIVWLQP